MNAWSNIAKLRLVAHPSDAPGCVKLVLILNQAGRRSIGVPVKKAPSILFQTDYDWPSVAGLFGWTPRHVPGGSTLDRRVPRGDACVGSGSTDGTVPCPDCGKSATEFITEAREWLDRHDGRTCEDPGYTFDL